jgi:hypothetical protein
MSEYPIAVIAAARECLQQHIQMRVDRLASCEARKERDLKWHDDQINYLTIKINKMKETLDQYCDEKTLREMSWNDEINSLKLQIQKLQNS